MDKKRVYTFGNGQAEGKADMKNLLGGKGANLAEMNLIGIPVPPGFTITTDVCTEYNTLGRDKVVELLKDEVVKSLTGESAFEPNILDMAIRGQEEKCAELRRAMAHAEEEVAKSQAAAEHIAKQYDEILEWAQLYDNCNISMKKVIVANMIDRVDVFRDYQLTIRLNITIEQFLISLENVA